MSTHDEVLDAIDQTLRDYEVSDDAMRWSPEPPPRRNVGKVFMAPLEATPLATGGWVHIGSTAAANWEPVAEGVVEFHRRFADAYATAMQQIKLTFTATAKSMAALYAALGIEPPAVKARRSARWSEYHRRQKRRNR